MRRKVVHWSAEGAAVNVLGPGTKGYYYAWICSTLKVVSLWYVTNVWKR
jgi:hypothetical protein